MFFVYQVFLDPNSEITGFSILGFNSNFKIISKKVYVGEGALNIFFDHIIMMSRFYMDKYKNNQIPLKTTARTIKELQATRKCYLCGVEKDSGFVSHHDHYSTLVNGRVVMREDDSNVLSYPCQECNLLIKIKDKVPVYGYGLTTHARQLLNHLAVRGTKCVTVIPLKTANRYASVIVDNFLQFIDIENHMNSAILHDLFKMMHPTDLYFLNDITSSKEEYEMISKGLPYPCNEQIETTSFPCYEQFKDYRYPAGISKEAYDRASFAYVYFQCRSLKEYCIKALEADVYCLASLVIAYARYCQDTFQNLTPLWDVTIGSYAYAAMMFITRTDFENITDGRVYRMLESSMLPGICISNSKREFFSNERLQSKPVPCERAFECLWVDNCSQYAHIISGQMPYKDIRLLSESEVKDFNVFDVNDSDNTCFIIQCTLEYPANAQIHTCDLPLGYW